MKYRSGLSGTSSGQKPNASTKALELFDVPLVLLDAREELFSMQTPESPADQAALESAISKLTACIRALGAGDIRDLDPAKQAPALVQA